jgi:Flp pilus assembly pilin Flp
MHELIDDESGTTLIEYALIASMTTVLLASVLSGLQDGVRDLFHLVDSLAGASVG